jgi:hypothetical protein
VFPNFFVDHLILCTVFIISVKHKSFIINVAPACSALGSWVWSEPTHDSRRKCRKPAHLLVVGVGDSLDPGPARSSRRPSEGRCGGCGTIGGEIAPPPPAHVSLDTARSDGHKNSELRQRGGGLDCRGSSEERCSPGNGSAATNQDPTAAGHKSCGHLAATARPGLTGRP